MIQFSEVFWIGSIPVCQCSWSRQPFHQRSFDPPVEFMRLLPYDTVSLCITMAPPSPHWIHTWSSSSVHRLTTGTDLDPNSRPAMCSHDTVESVLPISGSVLYLMRTRWAIGLFRNYSLGDRSSDHELLSKVVSASAANIYLLQQSQQPLRYVPLNSF